MLVGRDHVTEELKSARRRFVSCSGPAPPPSAPTSGACSSPLSVRARYLFTCASSFEQDHEAVAFKTGAKIIGKDAPRRRKGDAATFGSGVQTPRDSNPTYARPHLSASARARARSRRGANPVSSTVYHIALLAALVCRALGVKRWTLTLKSTAGALPLRPHARWRAATARSTPPRRDLRDRAQ